MISKRMDGIRSFIVMDILEKALELEARGMRVIHLEVGEPDHRPPPPVEEAAVRAMRDGHTHYTHSLGIRPLREGIARHYHEHYGVDVDPERVIVTVGTSGGFALLLGVLLDPGERVLTADPGYPCYPNFARYVNAAPVSVPVDAADGFVMGADAVAEAGTPGDLVLVSSPANPTGTVTPRETYQGLVERGFRVISDEIYHGLVYTDQPEFTALEIDDDIIVVNGFSKRYAMTGFRLGWMIVPPKLIRPVNRLAQNLFISAPAPSQWAGVAALEEAAEWVEETRAEYRLRRDLLVGILRDLGFVIHRIPDGAFYVFADVSAFGMDSFDFCQRMLEEAGVAATPGRDFGGHRTDRFVRFAYTNSAAAIREAGEMLKRWLPTI